jgi:hypothetical protein
MLEEADFNCFDGARIDTKGLQLVARQRVRMQSPFTFSFKVGIAELERRVSLTERGLFQSMQNRVVDQNLCKTNRAELARVNRTSIPSISRHVQVLIEAKVVRPIPAKRINEWLLCPFITWVGSFKALEWYALNLEFDDPWWDFAVPSYKLWLQAHRGYNKAA